MPKPSDLWLALCVVALLPCSGWSQEIPHARKLINAQGCKACHALEGDGGTLAVTFAAMRDNLTRSDIRRALISPSGMHGNSRIPDFSHLSAQEIASLIEFIQPAGDDSRPADLNK